MRKCQQKNYFLLTLGLRTLKFNGIFIIIFSQMESNDDEERLHACRSGHDVRWVNIDRSKEGAALINCY